MNMEQAIQTALEYETKIFELYREAAETVQDPKGKRTLQLLRDDELSHIDYLKLQLETWKSSGRIDSQTLSSNIPPAQDLAQKVQNVQQKLDVKDKKREREVLEAALRAEVETGIFYEQMVRELPKEQGALFAGFLQIEKNHQATVQFELDYLAHTGYWFDVAEFDLEAY